MGGERSPGLAVEDISTGRVCSTCTRGCYAPVFRASSWPVCLAKKAAYAALLTLLPILLVLSGSKPSIACSLRRLLFRLEHCQEGNQNREIDLEPDSYGSHVRNIKQSYGKTEEWEQWMLANRDRYQVAFGKARLRPAAVVIAYRYESLPIAYNPPWSSEVEHMTAMKSFADLSYPCFDFEFAFGGDTAASYANVIAGTSSHTSYAAGKNVYLYFETIFAHEFGHVMGVAHHYDRVDASDAPAHMPPGETLCLMARNWNQWCSACRTALCIPLDVDHPAGIDAAMQEIIRRYPY
jgi:hypothetical protein